MEDVHNGLPSLSGAGFLAAFLTKLGGFGGKNIVKPPATFLGLSWPAWSSGSEPGGVGWRVSKVSPRGTSPSVLALLPPGAPTKALLSTRGVEGESGEGWERVWAMLAANHKLELLHHQKAEGQL